MRKILGLSFTIALALGAIGAVPAVAESDNARPNISDEETVGAFFDAATDVVTYQVTIPRGPGGAGRNGRLTVATADCCAPGDMWGIRIIKANGQVIAEGLGDGTFEYSGAATIPTIPGKTVTVEVYYSSGIDRFPAGAEVRFRFGGENIVVTEL